MDEQPTYFAHYRGNIEGKVEGQILGPNLFNEYLRIIDSEYDPETNLTTVGLVIHIS